MKVILDTNFILIPGELKVDIFEQINDLEPNSRFFVVHFTIEELEKIVKTGNGKEKEAARVAQQLIEQRITILPSHNCSYADDEILDHATEGYTVATLDKAFKERLKSHNISVITLRQRKFVVAV